MELILVFSTLLGFYVLTIFILHVSFPESHYDWSGLDLEEMKFPSDFIWGVATASHQIEGNNTNNWSRFENTRGIERSGLACDHWSRWEEDHALLVELGVTSYRFSIEWSRIQPEKNEWDDDAIQVYSKMVDSLICLLYTSPSPRDS